MANPVTDLLLGHAGRLRFPTLFAVALGLWLLDLLMPDPLPLIDELLMGLVVLMLSRWRKPDSEAPPQKHEREREGRIIDGESRRER